MRMKNLISAILIGSLSASLAFADAKSEGVSTEIDVKRLNDVMTEVNNSKFTLDTETENIAKSDIADQEKLYAELLERLLAQSGTKPNEFLMRNILYRTQSIYAHVKDLPSSPKRDLFARRILEQGMTWAQKLYEPDKKLLALAQQKQLPEELRGATFASIGLQWAHYVLNLYYLAPTSAAKLQLMRDMMGQMYNDILNDDAVKRIEAPVAGGLAVKYEALNKLFPADPVEKLTLSRDLRRFMDQHLAAAEKLLAQYPTVFSTEIPTISATNDTSIKDGRWIKQCPAIGIGKKVFNTYSNEWADILAIQPDGNYVIKTQNGQVASNWSVTYFIQTGCGCTTDHICAGDQFINTYNNLYVTVIGVHPDDGTVVLRFDTGTSKGKVEANWQTSYLARTH
jgi:hypothetical protein